MTVGVLNMSNGIDWEEFLIAVVIGIIGVAVIYLGIEFTNGLAIAIGGVVLVILFIYIGISHR